MSKKSNIPFNYLLIKIDQVKYKTPCGRYSIEFTNFGYIDDVNWIARKESVYYIYAETLPDLLSQIVIKDPFLETDLYKLLYGVPDDN